eukprot:scaffold281_cov353-Pinguiococcus_pyrenoidosus.AAC.1
MAVHPDLYSEVFTLRINPQKLESLEELSLLSLDISFDYRSLRGPIFRLNTAEDRIFSCRSYAWLCGQNECQSGGLPRSASLRRSATFCSRLYIDAQLFLDADRRFVFGAFVQLLD